VEQARRVEQGGHFGDQVGADFVVSSRRNHAAVLAQPGVVGRAEVEFGDGFEARARAGGQVRAQPVGRPRTVDGDFGMAVVTNGVAQVEQDEVHARARHRLGEFGEQSVIAAQVGIEQAAGVRVVFRPPVFPHIHADVQQVAPDHGWVASRRMV
jgi:hypothetical protein